MQTVIGAFDDRDTAQRAVERLVEAGFDREDVHLEPGALAQGAPGDSTDGAHTEEPRGLLASYGHVFASLFGADDPHGHTGMYTEAVRRGASLVVVDAQDKDRVLRAADVLRELGATGVDETGERSARRGGVRVIERDSQPPLRELVHLREQQGLAGRQPERPSAARNIDGGQGGGPGREDRAFASGDGEAVPQSRDPEAGQAPPRRKTLKLKPGARDK